MKEDSSYSSEGEVCMNAIEETIYTIRKSRNNAFKKTGINMKYGYYFVGILMAKFITCESGLHQTINKLIHMDTPFCTYILYRMCDYYHKDWF